MYYDIVSSSTPSYYSGIIALWNSIQLNSPKCDLTVYCYDQERKYKKLEDLGIKVILNAELPGPIVSKGVIRPNGGPVNEDMYVRLIIPQHFKGRVFYVDADCLILKPIYELWEELDLEDTPTACVFRMDIGWIGGNIHDDMASGTFLLDVDKWEELGITKKCFDAMAGSLAGRLAKKFSVNVESVMSYVHRKNFLHLDRKYQNLTYYGVLSKEDKVAHFAGVKPWKSSLVNYKQLWHAYYKNDIDGIKFVENRLPDELHRTIHYKERAKFRARQNKWSSI